MMINHKADSRYAPSQVWKQETSAKQQHTLIKKGKITQHQQLEYALYDYC